MHNDDQDILLMGRIKADDWNAFAKLYERHKHRIINFFYHLSGDARLAEDGLQDVFFRVWQYRGRYQPRARVSTYLYCIARNYWLNQAKRSRYKPVSLDTSGRDGEMAEDSRQQVIDRELYEKVNEAIGQLPLKEREVLILSQYQGLKYREIAEVLDIAEITVKTRMARAIKRLKKYLGSQLNLNDRS